MLIRRRSLAARTIKAAFSDYVVFGNGDVREFADIAKFSSSGVDGVMVGYKREKCPQLPSTHALRYGALRNPAVFSSTLVPLEIVLADYLSVSAKYKNRFIDVLRHLGWILKSHVNAETRAKLFTCMDLHQVMYAS